jgi:hypothetical protein
MSLLGNAPNELEIVAPVVNLAAAGAANATALFTFPSAASVLGNESLKLKKIRLADNGTGGTLLHIGTGVAGAFAALVPPIRTISGFDLDIDLPPIESFATITAYPDAVGGNSIDAQLIVTEKI